MAEQCGGAPSATQRLLIDRIAVVALRVQLIDRDPLLPDRDEYLELTKLLAALLAQLGGQCPASSIVHRPPIHEVAA